MFRRAALALVRRPALTALSPYPAHQVSHKYTCLASRFGVQLNNQLPPTGVRYFNQELTANWPEGIKKFLEKEKIEKPTLIQEKTLPIVLKDRDLVGIARTGSGKTLAFVIPAIMKILDAKEASNSGDRYESRPPTCLVLAPTRELANQTGAVINKFKNLGLNSICLVGGNSRHEQVRELSRHNQDFYVATPGRLMDLIETNCVDLSQIKYLVLDEADRMLDMGFEPQIRRIISSIPKDRQTVMWSATWPKEIQSLASEFMRDYEYVAVDSESLKANPNIKQEIEICAPMNKIKVLVNHLARFKEECSEPRTLVFVNTKRMAESLLLHLMRNRIRAISIHGDRSQKQRDDALRMFKNRLCNTLVATDVAARGIDISDISHVVNFDFPNTIEDYVHRIGRTARADRKGTAVSLLTENNANIAHKLIGVLKETDQPVPDELQSLATQSPKYFNDNQAFGGGQRRQRNDFYSSGGQSRHGGSRPQRQDYNYSRQPRDYNYSRQPNRGRDEYGSDDDDLDMGHRGYRNNRSDRYDDNPHHDNRRRSRGGVFDDD